MTSKQALGLTMNELAEANAEHVTTISKLEQKLTDMAVQLANSESKCRELAVENVTLNDKMNRLATWPGIEFYSSAWEFCNLDGNDALEFMCDVKTPATDAFLAEVRAQGVEMAACALDDVNQFNYANMLDDLAQKLRKGASL
ncbi:hypothetical protein WE580_13940 [Citrobacter freundii]|uniref:hypothetical protein n=1 Tax=Citrobacter TaxID=544 RepID=UPI0010053E2C|nr:MULTISPECIES: hypothetical protein [Citrobacter]MCT4734365.1 hypothetical protein [Citrobacter freundii]MDE9596099.1 hypothetical protein [Citrobacter freundii]MDE9714846.1 hypothetical protein [Citrobacter freundii]MDE9724973.1 hypothetical protein [Citrobacter freundii]MDE9734654.1 hypothetical protein [Citrobacter freundii]